ncbi:MAG: hypothetical protein H7138_26110, partial [Myxococcales bacterium]|nr:hypothetical protein [Myxococcales bacterium]
MLCGQQILRHEDVDQRVHAGSEDTDILVGIPLSSIEVPQRVGDRVYHLVQCHLARLSRSVRPPVGRSVGPPTASAIAGGEGKPACDRRQRIDRRPRAGSPRPDRLRGVSEGPRSERSPRDPAQPLKGARVVVCVAGGVAAYKAAELVRLLDRAGAKIDVAMTARAQKFVGPMTFQALTRRPVFTDLFSLTEEATIGHIQLADQADLIVIAPATANTIARLAAGQADDTVTAIVLATQAPVLVAPSMNVNMWSHPLTQANVARLTGVAGYRVVGPGDGFLACRWTGPGRLAEPADIVEAAAHVLSPQ